MGIHTKHVHQERKRLLKANPGMNNAMAHKIALATIKHKAKHGNISKEGAGGSKENSQSTSEHGQRLGNETGVGKSPRGKGVRSKEKESSPEKETISKSGKAPTYEASVSGEYSKKSGAAPKGVGSSSGNRGHKKDSPKGGKPAKGKVG